MVIKNAETLEVDAAGTQRLRGNRPVQHNTYAKGRAEIAPAPVRNINADRDKSGVVARGANEVHTYQDDLQRPEPLTGADVKYIKIVDFDKRRTQEKKNRKDIKIRYF